MGFRFRKSIRLLPGVRLNFSTRGTSLSLGGRGATVNLSRRGTRMTLGIPGTGISYQASSSQKSGRSAPRISQSASAPPPPRSAPPPLQEICAQITLDEQYRLVFCDARTGLPLTPAGITKARQQHAEAIDRLLADAVAHYNQPLQLLLGVHLATPAPQQALSLTPRPFQTAKPQPPKPPDLSLTASLWPPEKARQEQAYRHAQLEYSRVLRDWAQARQQHLDREQQRITTLQHARQDSVPAAEAALDEAIRALEWPRETLVSYELAADGHALALDVDLPEIEDLPVDEARPGREGLRIQPFSKSRQHQNYALHIHGILFRLLGECFAILPQLEQITASGYTQRLNTATGHLENQYVISVRLRRERWQRLNFANLAAINPVEALAEQATECVRRLVGNGALSPITPLPLGFVSQPPPALPASPPTTITDLVAGANAPLGIQAGQAVLIKIVLACLPDQLPVTVDASAFLLDSQGHVHSDTDFVFYNQPNSTSDALLLHLGLSQQHRWTFTLDVGKLPTEVMRIAFALTLDVAGNNSHHFAMFDQIWMGVLVGESNQVRLRFEWSPLNQEERALIVGELYRRTDEWKFRAIGQGFFGGLSALAKHYGVDVSG